MIDPKYGDELLEKLKLVVKKCADTKDVQVHTEIPPFLPPGYTAMEAVELAQLQTLINRACWGTNVRGYICPGYGSDDRIYNFIFSRG